VLKKKLNSSVLRALLMTITIFLFYESRSFFINKLLKLLKPSTQNGKRKKIDHKIIKIKIKLETTIACEF